MASVKMRDVKPNSFLKFLPDFFVQLICHRLTQGWVEGGQDMLAMVLEPLGSGGSECGPESLLIDGQQLSSLLCILHNRICSDH